MKNTHDYFRVLAAWLCCISLTGAGAQAPAPPADLKALGTRSWIRLTWQDNASDEQGYNIYWSKSGTKPSRPAMVVAPGKNRCYIEDVEAETNYRVWLEAVNASGVSADLMASVTTVKTWAPDPEETARLSIPSSAAVPEGMELFWHDEFNDEKLNRNKWSTNYYSTGDLPMWKVPVNSRPQPIMTFDGSSITLLGEGIISSIQTYDWGTDENLLDNSRGGYFEVRVRRNKLDPAGRNPNTAFWLDAPGPDLKRYMEKGKKAYGVTGIRPPGQVFEIDVFELLNAQFVLHGRVSAKGKFKGNLATHIAEGYTHIDNWVTHGVLWGPGIVSHYIDGNLIRSYNDKRAMYAPNHLMNVLLGAYINGKMEVDYIRGYRWPLERGNELPNPGFEANESLLPWEGNAVRTTTKMRSGKAAVVLEAGQAVTQYVYLDNNTNYRLVYWLQGAGDLEIKAENITAVTGVPTGTFVKSKAAEASFSRDSLDLETELMYGTDLKVVKITFTNTGRGEIVLDDVELVKGGAGGNLR